MKIRNGFVSNSSTSSFIISKKYSVQEVDQFLRGLVDIHNVVMKNKGYDEIDINHEICGPYLIDDILIKHESFNDQCKADLLKDKNGWVYLEELQDNALPYWMHEALEDTFGAIGVRDG